MSMENSIREKLTAAFAPQHLEIINESRLHAGHLDTASHGDGAFPAEGETHFRLRIVASAFDGMNRLARHRAVNDLLAAELAGTLHALAIEASAPGEPARR